MRFKMSLSPVLAQKLTSNDMEETFWCLCGDSDSDMTLFGLLIRTELDGARF